MVVEVDCQLQQRIMKQLIYPRLYLLVVLVTPAGQEPTNKFMDSHCHCHYHLGLLLPSPTLIIRLYPICLASIILHLQALRDRVFFPSTETLSISSTTWYLLFLSHEVAYRSITTLANLITPIINKIPHGIDFTFHYFVL